MITEADYSTCTVDDHIIDWKSVNNANGTFLTFYCGCCDCEIRYYFKNTVKYIRGYKNVCKYGAGSFAYESSCKERRLSNLLA